MTETGTISIPSTGPRVTRSYAPTAAPRSIARRLRTYVAPETDIETYPDRRSRGEKAYDALLFAVIAIIFVPWLCLIGGVWLIVSLLDDREPPCIDR